MSTLLQLRDEIIADANILGHKDFNKSRLDRIINLASRYVQIQLNGLGMKKWETSLSLTTPDLVASTYAGASVITIALSLLTNIIESPNAILQIDCTGVTDSGIAIEIDYHKYIHVINGSYSVPTEKEPKFMRLANQIYLNPTTITNVNIFYHKVITTLVADTDVTEMPMEFERFIIKKSVMEIRGLIDNIVQNESTLDNEIQVAYEKFLNIERQEKKAVEV